MFKFIIIFLFNLLLVISMHAYGQQEGDKIIAIVGNEIITYSDLKEQVTYYMLQNNLTQYSDTLLKDVYNNMVIEKLIYAKGMQDSISASEDEVQKQLDYRVKSMIDKYGSEKNIEQESNVTMAKLKQVWREDIRKQIIVDKVKQNRFSLSVKITSPEIIKFYEQYKDSLPDIPETYELYQIIVNPTVSEESKSFAYEKAKTLLDSIKSGIDFSEIAKKYSEDPGSAAKGGDLGKVKRGVFVKEFEDAAYLLKPGEISNPVETQFGYHIIKLISKSGDLIEVKHILVKFPKSQSSDFDAINQLKDLKSRIMKGEKTFQEMAVLYSKDRNVAKDSGYTGKIPLSNFDILQRDAIRNLQNGEICDPVRIGDNDNYTYAIFILKNKFPEHKLTLENDYKIIENYALSNKENKEINEWVKELKKTVFYDCKEPTLESD